MNAFYGPKRNSVLTTQETGMQKRTQYGELTLSILLCGFVCLCLAVAAPVMAQSFIKKESPVIRTPYVAIPDHKDFPKGRSFEFIPPNKAQNGMELSVWEKVKKAEQKRPTFYNDDLDIANAEIARQWTRLYNLAKNQDLKTRLKYVNQFFNQWPEGLDEKLWQVDDYWANPWEFMAKGGDCEDFAIAKFYALKTLGVPPKDLCLVIVDDFKAMITHVVLVAMDPNGRDFYVLDNNTNVIYKNGGAAKFVPRYYINEYNVWRPAE